MSSTPVETAVLAIKGLKVNFDTPEGVIKAVNHVDLNLEAGDIMAVVGESGSGKSQLAMAIMGLLSDNGTASGEVVFDGRDLLKIPLAELNQIRGRDIAMIFQEAGSALNPYLTIGRQMTEVLEQHRNIKHREALKIAEAMLQQVQISDPEERLRQFPHELSGGMQQRISIAMALLCQPRLLIADEPTTALDVTVQADINQLMLDLREQFGTSILLISHDLGVVAGLADKVAVMYAGHIMEFADVRDLYYRPANPYTKALLRSVPRLDQSGETLMQAIPGTQPTLLDIPSGCPFRDRCEYAFSDCTATPLLRQADHGGLKRCHLDRLPE